jgi:large subunit ribosomal protein L23
VVDNLYRILKRPLITERATRLKALANQYAFRVDTSATKKDIQLAVENLFRVKVLGVNTLRIHGKFRRVGASAGANRPDWKKAIVTVKAGQEIKILEEGK